MHKIESKNKKSLHNETQPQSNLYNQDINKCLIMLFLKKNMHTSFLIFLAIIIGQSLRSWILELFSSPKEGKISYKWKSSASNKASKLKNLGNQYFIIQFKTWSSLRLQYRIRSSFFLLRFSAPPIFHFPWMPSLEKTVCINEGFELERQRQSRIWVEIDVFLHKFLELIKPDQKWFCATCKDLKGYHIWHSTCLTGLYHL